MDPNDDAMALIDARLNVLERKIDFVLEKLGLTYEREVPPMLRPVAELLREGRRKEALEAYCEATGGSLAAARAAIYELRATMPKG